MAKQSTGKKATGKPGNKGQKKDKDPSGGKLRQLRVAFSITRQRDPRLVAWVSLGFLAAFGVALLILTLVGGPLVLNLIVAILAGVLAFMIIFGRRAQRAAFAQVAGQPGAAAWVLEGMRGNWRTTPAVAGNSQLDTVHRVIGRPGVILVGEGMPQRVRNLLAQEKKRTARVSGDTPIYDVIVGDNEGQVALNKLSKYFLKLPRNLSPAQVNALDNRLQALGGSRAGLPRGPLPKNARVSGLERTIRRR